MYKFTISNLILDNPFIFEINEDEFNNIKENKEVLSTIFSKENKYAIILKNYYEFEKELFEIILENEISKKVIYYAEANDYKLRIEQKFLNLFSSITFYRDSYSNKNLNKYPSLIVSEIKNINKVIKNKNEKYEIMQHLRNHLQHNSFLIDTFSLPNNKLANGLREITIDMIVSKTNIKAKYFKLDDFPNIPDEINIKDYTRDYVDFMGDIHKEFIELTVEKVNKSREYIQNLLNKYNTNYLLVKKICGNVELEEFQILLNWDDVRIKLQEENKVPTFFKKSLINTK
jgi:hypothetical protein